VGKSSSSRGARRVTFLDESGGPTRAFSQSSMDHDGSLLGLWIVRDGDQALLARVQDELYLLAFSSAGRAGQFLRALATDGALFYICAANLTRVTREARDAGARGFIVDYDAGLTRFASAHPLPAAAGAREAG
jgi:hypothetical protein